MKPARPRTVRGVILSPAEAARYGWRPSGEAAPAEYLRAQLDAQRAAEVAAQRAAEVAALGVPQRTSPLFAEAMLPSRYRALVAARDSLFPGVDFDAMTDEQTLRVAQEAARLQELDARRIDDAHPGTVDPRTAIREWAAGAEQTAADAIDRRSPGLLDVARAHPVATFALGALAGALVTWGVTK